ncbi:hypothetical protein L9F63_006396 [Diploptera punctata]|uniref:VLRF1 domain-containing protein n=1 Tax=Diploptera punctata TaxID=6984 RepID=A0AAD8E4K9_DIPPU|nr:hypothetical protein L9F63_006396 [Diploptera punctata]
MDYKVYKIFELENFNKLMNGVKVAQCMGSCSTDITKEDESQMMSKLEDLSVSEILFCSFCNTSFENQIQQRMHYKLDWHRYNLKQKLNGLKTISEEKFTQLADDDLSSISGSDSESDSDDEEAENSDSVAIKHTSQQNENNNSITSTEKGKDDNGAAKLRLLATRHAKVFFENADGHIFSLYRCLLHGKKDIPESDEKFIPLALKAAENPMWVIIMLGGGHFAAGIFQGKEVLVHKTFHCYTVRARQGGTQSSRDGRSGGSHPKSAGASLRRYNEQALIQHVQDIMDSWASYLKNCGLILYRAVGHNRNVLFSGKNPPLNKEDTRLRTIPFPTRRATFSEVKRVHDILASLEIYGSADSFQTAFPQSPRKKIKSQVPNEGTCENNTMTTAQDQNKETNTCQLHETDNRKNGEAGESITTATSAKRGSKPVIDRAKPRKSPHRPLPGIVNAILARSSSESDMSEKQYGLTCHMQQKEQVEKEPYSAPVMMLRRKLWTACQLGDTELLINSLAAVQPIEEEPDDCGNEADEAQPKKDNVVIKEEYLKCLNENVGESKDTLLTYTYDNCLKVQGTLMEAGCDPSVKNKKSQTPYVVSANKETRNTFRRFLADFPDKYDYSKSQISGPLTDEMEQKLAEKRREQRKVKREREKERKKEEEARKEEESEKERYLRLSDREKRALAAERRMMSQPTTSGSKIVVSRCFQCAADISGKVPFEYDIHRFCSMNCLKEHRLKTKEL